MPQRKGTRKRAPMKGAGIFGDIWDGIKKGVGAIKDAKLISKGLSAIADPRAQTAASVAGALGFGKKKRSQKARGLMTGMVKKPMYGMGAKTKMTVL